MEITSESEINDLRKRIVADEEVSDEEIRAAIAFMRQQRSNGGSSRSTNQQPVDLDSLL